MNLHTLLIRPALWQLTAFCFICSTTVAEPRLKSLLLPTDRGNESSKNSNHSMFDALPPTIVESGSSGSMWGKFEVQRMRRECDTVNQDARRADVDEEQAERAANRALRMQASDSAQEILRKSELRPVYQSAMEYVTKARNALRVQVHATSKGLDLSQTPRRKKPLMQFALEPSISEILEPVISVGQSARFRYNNSSDAVLFELQSDW